VGLGRVDVDRVYAHPVPADHLQGRQGVEDPGGDRGVLDDQPVRPGPGLDDVVLVPAVGQDEVDPRRSGSMVS
jgi:hypothetical protein